MAVITPPPFLQGGSHSAKSFRQLTSALVGQDVETFAGGVGALGVGHGLVRSGHFAVAQNGTPNMSVNVAKGTAFVTGTSSLAQGVYVVTSDATVNLAIATADGANPRRDLVVVQVRDTTEDAGGDNDARLAVVTGTPGAVPTDPAVPAGCLVVARVAVAAAASSIVNANITMLAGLARGSNWNVAWGVVATPASRTSDAGPIASVTDVGGVSVSWTAVPGRLYRTSFKTDVIATVPGALIVVQAATSGNVQVCRALMNAPGASGFTLTSWAPESGLSGAQTRKMRAEVASGGGSVTVEGSSTSPIVLQVEDIGPA